MRSISKVTQRRITLYGTALLLCFAWIAMSGCGGGGGSSTSAQLGTISGVVYAPDGITPVADATVYVPTGRAAAPPEEAITWTASGNDGSFVLNNIPVGLATVKIIKGYWTRSFEVMVQSSQTLQVAKAMTTLLESIDAPPGTPFPGGDGDLDEPPAPPSGDAPVDPPPSDPF